MVRRWFPNDEWRHMYYTDNVSATSFHDFYSPELNLSVVTVRGTYSFWDVLSDINLFYEVAAIQMASTVLPITSILPDSIVSWIIQGANAGNLNDRYATVAVTAPPPTSPAASVCVPSTELGFADRATQYGELMTYVKDARHGTNTSSVQRVHGPRDVVRFCACVCACKRETCGEPSPYTRRLVVRCCSHLL